jgi:DNA-binding CsgD family transcriptional regulator
MLMRIGIFKPNNVVNIRAMRKNKLPYVIIWMLYYAWVVAFTTWWTASPVTERVFDSGLRTLIHSINLISSAVFIFLMRKVWFVLMSRIGAILIITGMSLYLIVPNTLVQTACVIAIGITLGMVNISILIPFVFALNNTEKLYSVVGSYVLINVIMLLQYRFINVLQPGNKEQLGTFLLLLLALSATIFFKGNSIETENKNNETPELKPRIYLTLVYNCVLAILCKGTGTALLNITAKTQGNHVYQWFYIGGLAGCAIYIGIYAFSAKAFIWLGNITFSCIAMGLMCNAFVAQLPELSIVFAFVFGIGGTIGMINMYYILVVIGKKYNSMRYLRLSILFIGICGGVSGVVVGNLIFRTNTHEISIVASLISAAFMLVFLVTSPIMVQSQYYNDWAKDSAKTEIENEQTDVFKKYNLSKREIEVCKLLLEGYTLRQISVILSIAYSTVNTYCTSTYRKLNINSRTELIMLFKDYVK